MKRSAADLAHSNAELEQFAYIASHDLQEPLRAVAGCVQLLQQRYQGQLDAQADELITYAVDGSSRMQTLIRDLLAYARVSTQGRNLEPIDSAAVLKKALSNLSIVIQESAGVVTYGALPTVAVDPTQLLQVFQNLIGNAIKSAANVLRRSTSVRNIALESGSLRCATMVSASTRSISGAFSGSSNVCIRAGNIPGLASG